MWRRPRGSSSVVKCKICNAGINQSFCKSCNTDNNNPSIIQTTASTKNFKWPRCRNKNPDGEIIITYPSRSLNYVGPAKPRPKKRAVLCGVSYKGVKFQLGGTFNDVLSMRDLLIHNFGYEWEWIRVLTEEETHPDFLPTRANIIKSMKWLVEDNRSGDSLVFFFSGHGLRQPDFEQDEIDGFDETICPLDYKEHGMIVDNEINSIMVSPLVEGVKLHAIVDACHSGTILDLPYVFDNDSKKWKDNRTLSGKQKTTKGGLAISISACDDNQMAADTSVFTKNTMNGAMTYLLVDQLKRFPGLKYGDYFNLICERIQDANRKKFFSNSRVLKRVFPNRLLENPIISSSKEIDIFDTPITL